MTAELFAGLSELPSSGVVVSGVAVMGATQQGTTPAIGLEMTVDRRGFALRRSASEVWFVLPWASVVRATCREVTVMADGRFATVLVVTTAERVVRLLMPFDQISSEQVHAIDRSIPHWATRFGGRGDLGAPVAPAALQGPFTAWMDRAPDDAAVGVRDAPGWRRRIPGWNLLREVVADHGLPRPVALGVIVGTTMFLVVAMTVGHTVHGSPSRSGHRREVTAAAATHVTTATSTGTSTVSESTSSAGPTTSTSTSASTSTAIGSGTSTGIGSSVPTTPPSALDGSGASEPATASADQISSSEARAELINVMQADLPAGWTVDTSGDVADSATGGQVGMQAEQEFGQCMQLTTAQTAQFFGDGAPASSGQTSSSSPTFDAPGDINIQIASDVRMLGGSTDGTSEVGTDGTSDFAVMASPEFGSCYAALEPEEIQQELDGGDGGDVGDGAAVSPAVVATDGTPSAVTIPVPEPSGALVAAYQFTVPVTLGSESPIEVEAYLVAIFSGPFEAEINTFAFGEVFPPEIVSAVTAAVEARAIGG